MLAIERRNLIFDMLQRDKRVVVSELSSLFNVSEETIRRDLEKLSEEGYVTKTYGGAVLNEDSYVDMPFVIRKDTNVAEKQIIGKLIADLVEDGEKLMVDSSTTSVFAARYLKSRKNITMITNSVELLVEMSDVPSFHVISTGGNLRVDTLSLTGNQVDKVFSSYIVDTAIFSCKGVDIAAGVTDSNEVNAYIKKTILSAARRKFLAVDHTKFNVAALVRICRVDELTHIITDVKPSDEWLDYLSANNIACVYPKNGV